MTEHEIPRRTPWLKIAGVVVVLAGLIAAIAYTASASRTPPGEAAATSATDTPLRVVGQLHLRSYRGIGFDGAANATGSACFGESGYDDIRAGTQVTVTADEKVVAVGALGLGEYDGRVCVFPLSVESIPRGHDFYSVEVAHRGAINYPAAQLAEPITVTLG